MAFTRDQIFGDGQITAHQLFQRSKTMFAVIHRGEMIEAQQLGQSAGVDLVVLAAFLHGLGLSWIAHQQFRHAGFQEVVQPGG